MFPAGKLESCGKTAACEIFFPEPCAVCVIGVSGSIDACVGPAESNAAEASFASDADAIVVGTLASLAVSNAEPFDAIAVDNLSETFFAASRSCSPVADPAGIDAGKFTEEACGTAPGGMGCAVLADANRVFMNKGSTATAAGAASTDECACGIVFGVTSGIARFAVADNGTTAPVVATTAAETDSVPPFAGFALFTGTGFACPDSLPLCERCRISWITPANPGAVCGGPPFTE